MNLEDVYEKIMLCLGNEFEKRWLVFLDNENERIIIEKSFLVSQYNGSIETYESFHDVKYDAETKPLITNVEKNYDLKDENIYDNENNVDIEHESHDDDNLNGFDDDVLDETDEFEESLNLRNNTKTLEKNRDTTSTAHDSTKPPCCMCGLSFRSQKNLLTHQKSCREKKLKKKETALHAWKRKKDFSCDVCGRHCSSLGFLDYHKRTRHEEGDKDRKTVRLRFKKNAEIKLNEQGKFMCPFENCPKAYDSEGPIYKHFHQEHVRDRLTCSSCQEEFSCTRSLLLHKDLKHNTGDGPYICEHCGQRFTYPYSVGRHMKQKHGNTTKNTTEEKKTGKCIRKCPYCEQGEYATSLELQEHCYTEHPKETTACEWEGCKKAFKTYVIMRKHFVTNHLKEKKKASYLCSWCQRPFKGKTSLIHHMDTQHPESNTESFACTENGCMKKFSTKASLKIHLQHHKKPRQVPCGYCGKVMNAQNLKSHIQLIHMGIKYPCDKCPNVYCSTTALTKHKLAIHEKRQLLCPICQKVFYMKNCLNVHIKAVHEKIRFDCGRCSKSYACQGDLREHVKSFHEGRKFYCNFCAKEFLRSSERNRHERTVHKAAMKDKLKPIDQSVFAQRP